MREAVKNINQRIDSIESELESIPHKQGTPYYMIRLKDLTYYRNLLNPFCPNDKPD